MSYCVHCGVKLASYEKTCPLCGTPVIDPNAETGKDIPRFVDQIDMSDRNLNRHFVFGLLTSLLILPAIITIIVDLCINHSLSWSLLVCGAEICFWFFIIYPFRYSLKHKFIYGIIDTVVVAFYILLIAVMFNGISWYLSIALPLLLMSGGFIAGEIYIFNREKANRIWIFGCFQVILSLYLFGINLITSKAVHGSYAISWAWWPSIPFFTIGIFFMVVSTNAKISEWLRKKLFI